MALLLVTVTRATTGPTAGLVARVLLGNTKITRAIGRAYPVRITLFRCWWQAATNATVFAELVLPGPTGGRVLGVHWGLTKKTLVQSRVRAAPLTLPPQERLLPRSLGAYAVRATLAPQRGRAPLALNTRVMRVRGDTTTSVRHVQSHVNHAQPIAFPLQRAPL